MFINGTACCERRGIEFSSCGAQRGVKYLDGLVGLMSTEHLEKHAATEREASGEIGILLPTGIRQDPVNFMVGNGYEAGSTFRGSPDR